MLMHRIVGSISPFRESADREPMRVRASVIHFRITTPRCDRADRRPVARMLASLLTSTGSHGGRARLAQRVPSDWLTKFEYGRDTAGLHQVGWCSAMTEVGQKVKAFIVIKVDGPEQNLSRIEETLEPLGIPVSIVETGRQLHWSTAVIVGVPEQRLADAMLALELQGFSDVMAFHGDTNTDATQRGVTQQ